MTPTILHALGLCMVATAMGPGPGAVCLGWPAPGGLAGALGPLGVRQAPDNLTVFVF